MVRILKEENPELLDQLMLEGVNVGKEEDADGIEEAMEKDLEID